MASWLSRTALWLPWIAPALAGCTNPGAGIVPGENQYVPQGPGSGSEQDPAPTNPTPNPDPYPSSTSMPTAQPTSTGTTPTQQNPPDAGAWHDASSKWDAAAPWDSSAHWDASTPSWDATTSSWDSSEALDTSVPTETFDSAPPPPPASSDSGAANTCATPTCGIDGLGNCGCQATANGQGYFLECQNNGQCECLSPDQNNNQNNFFFDDQACFDQETIEQLFIQACQCP
jgi:hypothetical protein